MSKNNAKAKNGDDRPERLKTKVYEKELERLQVELTKVQAWAQETGARIVVIFEGRDAAGKGGVIKRITQWVSPRVVRTVALPKPTDREKTQFYFQRYIEHLPAAGEIVLFDRSWYNRAGVERVMGFCTEHQAQEFLRLCPQMEKEIIRSGIQLIKYWFDVSQEEQTRRFMKRIHDPLRQWKLSPIDIAGYDQWWDMARYIDEMFDATDIPESPWYVVDADQKRRARLNCISHLLSLIPYEEVPHTKPELPERQEKPEDISVDRHYRHLVPKRY